MTKKTFMAMIIALALLASCGEAAVVEKVDIPKTNDKSPTNTTSDRSTTKPQEKPTDKNTEPKTTTSDQPDKVDISEEQENVPEAVIAPLENSQLITAMKLVPKEAFDVSNTEGVAALCYANQQSCFKRMKYDFKKNIDEITKQTPLFFYDIVKSPRNDFENPKNWLWTITDITLATHWMAGNFNLNMNMPPILKKEKYKQYPLEYQYAYSMTPEDVLSPRYGKFVCQLADSLVMLSESDVASLARKTAVNIAEKGKGVMDNQDYAKLLSYLGEPEAASLVRVEKSMDIEKILSDPNASKMPEEFRKVLELIKNNRRSPDLKYYGLGFYPEEEFNLRFMLYYKSSQEAKTDMGKIKQIWNNPLIVKGEGWRKMVSLKQTRFSVKDNMGIIECKTDKTMSGIDVVSSISVLLLTSSFYSLVK